MREHRPRLADSFATRFAGSLAASDAAGLAALALRTGSTAVVDILASAPATSEWRLHLARVHALWPHPPGPDLAAAADLIRDVTTEHGFGALDPAMAGLFSQILLAMGRRDEVTDLLGSVPVDAELRWSIETDLVNPFTQRQAVGPWSAAFSRIFQSLEPIDVRDADQAPFERLTAVPTATTGGELVSVVMPVYRPDRGVLAAARSVLAQSWSDVELIVVDDGSPAEFRDLFAAVAELDRRVRIVRADANGGTYAARNLGLDAARGTYVTFHDADDWAHPRRIETQVRPMLERPDLLGTRSRAVRTFPDLRVTYVGYPPIRVNASSLLFRRRQALDAIGHFDDVRKSGDIEFPARLIAAVPGSVTDLDGPPLSVVQLRKGSLSRADAVPGWLHWERLAYRDRYREWHSRIRHGLADPRLPARRRPFPIPAASWASNPSTAAPETRRRFDVVYLDDWRKTRGVRFESVAEVGTLVAAGRSVAVADAEALVPLTAHREDRSWTLSRLVADGVPFVYLDEDVDAELLVVADPGVLQILPERAAGLRAANVIVLTDGPDAHLRPDEVELGFRIADCNATSEREFDTRPVWLPRSAHARQWLRHTAPDVRLADGELPVAPGAPGRRTTRRSGPRPVIGHHLPDCPASWPADRHTLLAAYPDDGLVDVRILRAGKSAAARIGTALPPASWVAFDRQPLTAAEFLRQLDMFVYFGQGGLNRDAVRSVLEAMAAGCVAVLPASFADEFGAAAVYATAETAASTVLELHADPERAAGHRARGLELVTDRTAAFVEALTAARSPQ